MTAGTVELKLPFTGRWLVQNSPANRVPSHGTELFGTGCAIDFVPVGSDGRSARRTLRSWFLRERPEAFTGFGRPILAPVAGTVIAVHDGEPDHEARRAPLGLLAYAVTQGERAGRGAAGLAGNHVAIEVAPDGPLVLLAHLRSGSVRVRRGDVVGVGAHVGDCGNSGNSTEPHLHVQVSDGLGRDARAQPLVFRWPDGTLRVPRNGEVIDAG